MSSSEYLDCELHLTDYNRATLCVDGRDHTGRPNLGDDDFRRKLIESALDTNQCGALLSEALLSGQDDTLLPALREGLAIARHQDKRLRFLLHVDTNAPKDLQDLPWEFLLDPKKGLAIGRSPDTAFSRYLSVDLKKQEAVRGKPRILIVISAPTGLEKYHLAKIERTQIQQATEEALSPLQNLVTFEYLEGPATRERIRDRLVGGRFHILHLYAHGWMHPQESTAKLVLEKDDCAADFISEDIFNEIFEGERSLRMITLIACYGGARSGESPFSGLGRSLVEKGLPAVLAMQQQVSIETAAYFSKHFYCNLGRTGRVDVASNEARLQLYLKGNSEWGTPSLFMRLKDGVLWPPRSRRYSPIHDPVISWSDMEWELLLDRLAEDKLLPILGPNICRGILPSTKRIASRWAAKYGYPLEGEPTLPSVSQYVTMAAGPDYVHGLLQETLVEELLDRVKPHLREALMPLAKKREGLTEVIKRVAPDYFEIDEDEPHLLLARLPISNYITTNIDSFMSTAIERELVRIKAGEQPEARIPSREHCRWNWEIDALKNLDTYKQLDGDIREPLIFHLFGNDLEPKSQVLTEDNFLDFLMSIAEDSNSDRIPVHIRAALVERQPVFLGYNISDLDCRALFRGLIQLSPRKVLGPEAPSPRKRIAVIQLESGKLDSKKVSALRSFAASFCGSLDIKIFQATVRGFLKELNERWNERQERQHDHAPD